MSDEESRARAANGPGAALTVSLKDVVMGGVCGPVSIGMTRAQVQEALGPHDWSARDAARRGDDPWRTSGIWKYGDLEFHFGLLEEDRLALIFMDDITVPHGGRAIALDPWIIRRDLSQGEAEQALRAGRISFRRIASRYDEDVTGLAVGARIRLWFTPHEPSEPPRLQAFVCTDPRLPAIETT